MNNKLKTHLINKKTIDKQKNATIMYNIPYVSLRIWKNSCLYLMVKHLTKDQCKHIKDLTSLYKGKEWNYDLYNNTLNQLRDYVYNNTDCKRIDLVLFKRSHRQKIVESCCNTFRK